MRSARPIENRTTDAKVVDGGRATVHHPPFCLMGLSMAASQILAPRTYNDDFLVEADRFFAERGEVHQTMKRLVRRLKRAKIPYVVVSGMAVNAHLYERMTKDMDVLLTANGSEQFQRLYVPKFYSLVPGFSRRFIDRKNQRGVDVLLTGLYPGSGKRGPIAFPDPKTFVHEVKSVRYIDLVNLIQLKLCARRHRDFADVVELIRYNHLDDSFLERLHPSVRSDFIECLEEKRREDLYQARNG
jgi:hypothetical protein